MSSVFSLRRLAVVAVLAGHVAAGPMLTADAAGATVAVRTWDGVPDGGGSSPNANWSTASNWVGDVAPSPGDALEFPNTAGVKSTANDFPAWTTFEAVRIVQHGLGPAGYTITGNAVVVRAEISSALSDTYLRVPVRLGGPVRISGSGGGITLTEPVQLDGHRLTLAGSGGVRLFRPLSGAGPSPAVVVAGGPALQASVNGSSTFTGGTRIDPGTLKLDTFAEPVVWPGDVQLNGGTLTGTGTVTGAVRASAAGGRVQPIEVHGLTVGSLSLNAASRFSGVNLFVPSGNVSLGGATLDIDAHWCGGCSFGMQRQLIHTGGRRR